MTLEIQCENYLSPLPYTFDIEWDGIWSRNLTDMEQHLRINEVKNERTL